jgi:hypothetical protein
MYRRTCRTAAPRVHGKVVRDGEDRFHEEDLDRSPLCPSSARPAGQSLPWTQRQRLRDCGPGGRPSPPAHPRRPTLFARPPSRCRNPTIRRSARCLIASPRLASCCWARRPMAPRSSTARAQITRRLIERHGFNIVAVEADWPDAARIDRYVRHKAVHVGSGPAFRHRVSIAGRWRSVDPAICDRSVRRGANLIDAFVLRTLVRDDVDALVGMTRRSQEGGRSAKICNLHR